MKRWIRWAAWLYPAEWRVRYGVEFEVLLDDATLRWSDLGDVIRGAVIMQMTTWTSYWKMAVVAGSVGAVLAAGVSFAIPNQYRCATALMIESPGSAEGQLAQEVQKAALEILGRDNLIHLARKLALYPEELRRMPVEEVAESTFRKHVHLQLYAGIGPNTEAFGIWFEYPDPQKAKATVQELIAEFATHSITTSDWVGTLSVLEDPILPERPSAPYRLVIGMLGALGGALLGLVSLKIWRRTRYAMVSVSVPKETRRYIASQVAAGQYRDASEYVRALIRVDESAANRREA